MTGQTSVTCPRSTSEATLSAMTEPTAQTYRVPAMSCAHCTAAIEGAVFKVEGVESVRVDLETRLVTVTGRAQDAAIRAAIDEAGYDIAE